MIQAINPMMSAVNVQPIKPVSFGKHSVPETFLREQTFGNEEDSFTPSERHTMQQKYDLACRLAAYNSRLAQEYKNKYTQLLEQGTCLA